MVMRLVTIFVGCVYRSLPDLATVRHMLDQSADTLNLVCWLIVQVALISEISNNCADGSSSL